MTGLAAAAAACGQGESAGSGSLRSFQPGRRVALVSVPAADPEVRPRRAVRLEESGVMRARRDAARPSGPLACR